MPQRNGQNPIRKANAFDQSRSKTDQGFSIQNRVSTGTLKCPSCNTETPPRPGFRLSSMKCPKCGAAMANK